MSSLRMIASSRRRWFYCALAAVVFVLFFNFKDYMDTKTSHSSCNDWKPSTVILRESRRTAPTINLDRNKFLLPWLYNGPTNQLWGLRQAAYLAIALNRTLVLPLFHKHITDRSGPGAQIDANHRFQLEALAKMLPMITLEEFSRRCHRKLDAVFVAAPFQRWMTDSLIAAEEELGFKILRRSPSGDIRIKELYNLPTISPEERRPDGDHDNLRSLYQTEAQCVLYTFPFREIKAEINRTVTMAEYLQHEVAFETFSDDVPHWFIANALFLKMQTPQYIQEAASDFLESTFGDELYMAIHWRYDEEDFRQFMCQKEEGVGNPHQADMCRKVFDITPAVLGQAIHDHIKFVNKEGKIAIRSVYISAPRDSILPFLRQLEDTLKLLQVQVFNQDDFDHFIRQSRLSDQCSFIDRDFNDFRALAEMEICARSRVFLRSTYSSWSDSVIFNRVLLHKESIQRRFDVPVISLKGLQA